MDLSEMLSRSAGARAEDAGAGAADVGSDSEEADEYSDDDERHNALLTSVSEVSAPKNEKRNVEERSEALPEGSCDAAWHAACGCMAVRCLALPFAARKRECVRENV